MLKEKQLILTVVFFAFLLLVAVGALVLFMQFAPLQPSAPAKTPPIISDAEKYIQIPKTNPTEAISISEKKISVLADSNEFEKISAILSASDMNYFEINYLFPKTFESDKNSPIILVVFSLDSSTELKQIAGQILSSSELALVEKSKLPFSLLKENVFAQRQQLALYLGKTKSDALKIFESSLKPLTKEELFENGNASSTVDQNLFLKSANTIPKNTDSTIFFGSLTASLPSTAETMGWYEENYEKLDEAYPSFIWELGHCFNVAASIAPCKSSGSYLIPYMLDSDGITLVGDGFGALGFPQPQIKDDTLFAKQYLGVIPAIFFGLPLNEDIINLLLQLYGVADEHYSNPNEKGQELYRGDFPYCYEYTSNHLWVHWSFPIGLYEAYSPNYVLPIILPRCIQQVEGGEIIHINVIAEILYQAYYPVWEISNAGSQSDFGWLPYSALYPYNVENITVKDGTTYVLDNVEVNWLKKHYISPFAGIDPDDPYNAPSSSTVWEYYQNLDAGLPGMGTLDEIPYLTFFPVQVIRPVRLYSHYSPWHKLDLENSESWAGTDYGERQFAEKYLFGASDFFAKEGTRIRVTAPSENNIGDKFDEWYIDGVTASASGGSAQIDYSNPRSVTIVMGKDHIIEAKFKPGTSFTFAVPGEITVEQGDTQTINIVISSTKGVNKPIKLELIKLQDTNLSFDLNQDYFGSIPANGSVTSKLSISAPYSAVPNNGYFKIRVTVDQNSSEKQFLIRLKEKEWNYRISNTTFESSRTLTPPENTVYGIQIESSKGFDLPLNFSLEGAPYGLNYYFSENPATPNPNSTKIIDLTLWTEHSAQAGSYPLTLRATSAWRKKPSTYYTDTINLLVNITIPAAPSDDFLISLNPQSMTLPHTGTGQITITATPVGAFNNPVAFSVENYPEAVNGWFTPSDSVMLSSGNPASVTLKFTVSNMTPAGTYNFDIKGTGGGITHTATAILTVSGP